MKKNARYITHIFASKIDFMLMVDILVKIEFFIQGDKLKKLIHTLRRTKIWYTKSGDNVAGRRDIVMNTQSISTGKCLRGNEARSWIITGASIAKGST